MKRYRMILCLCMSLAALLMPETTAFAQQLWKTCWSPDGEKIAFGDGSDIWMINSSGGEPVNMTTAIDEVCSCPAFSPDGGEILYSVLQNMGINSTDNDNSNILGMNIETGETRIVFKNSYAITFSRDGRYAVYIKNRVLYGVYDFLTDTEKTFDFYNSDPPYFCGGHASISPGNKDFVTRLENGSNTPLWNKYKLYRITMETGKAEIINVGKSNYVYPEYSPDGKFLLFSQADADKKYQLVIYDFISKRKTLIDNSEASETKCGSWSPEGGEICYIRNENDTSALYVYDIRQGKRGCLFAKSISGNTTVEINTPVSFNLYPNFPNPFNPSTTITFSLESAGKTHLDILNMTGQNICRLISRNMIPGTYSVVWNGRDTSGNAVSSGVYIYSLTMGEQVMTKKMTLVR